MPDLIKAFVFNSNALANQTVRKPATFPESFVQGIPLKLKELLPKIENKYNLPLAGTGALFIRITSPSRW